MSPFFTRHATLKLETIIQKKVRKWPTLLYIPNLM